MKRLTLVLLVLILAGCNDPITPPPSETGVPSDTPQATETADVTVTPSATATPENTATASVEPSETAVPTATEFPTPTRIVPVGDNLLHNSGFEGSWYSRIFPEIAVVNGWEPFYCDHPYIPPEDRCPVPHEGTKNPEGLLMGRPEYKTLRASQFPQRVYSDDQSQSWFCFSRSCDAGVYQWVATVPGVTYEVGAMMQAWVNCDDDPASDFDTCRVNGEDVVLDTEDALDNVEFYIAVNLSGDTFAFAQENFECVRVTHDEADFYDQYVPLSCEFVANSSEAVVFYGALFNWRFPNQDAYIDDAYVRVKE